MTAFWSLVFLKELGPAFHFCNFFKEGVRSNPRLWDVTPSNLLVRAQKDNVGDKPHGEMKSRTSVGTPKKSHFTAFAEQGTPLSHK